MPPKSHDALASFRFVSLCCAQRIAVWINGPTYSGKLSRNRNAGSNGVWPSFGDADDDEEAGVGSLFLRGASSHCLIAPDTGGTFSLELCRSREHGTLLTLDADGRFIDEGDTLDMGMGPTSAEKVKLVKPKPQIKKKQKKKKKAKDKSQRKLSDFWGIPKKKQA